MARDEILKLRLSPEEMADLRAEAARVDRSISYVARTRIFSNQPFGMEPAAHRKPAAKSEVGKPSSIRKRGDARTENIRADLVAKHGEGSELIRQFDESHGLR